MNVKKPTDNDADEQFRALMEGLRTTIPGVTVLFGFLLALPFQSDFAELEPSDRLTYAVAFFSTAAAAILLISPSVHQRVRGLMTGLPRRHQAHVHVGVILTVAGTVMFLVAIVASTYMVARVVFGSDIAAVALAVTAGLAGWSWFYLPLVTFSKWPREDAPAAAPERGA